jgi:hypothetical protein
MFHEMLLGTSNQTSNTRVKEKCIQAKNNAYLKENKRKLLYREEVTSMHVKRYVPSLKDAQKDK